MFDYKFYFKAVYFTIFWAACQVARRNRKGQDTNCHSEIYIATSWEIMHYSWHAVCLSAIMRYLSESHQSNPRTSPTRYISNSISTTLSFILLSSLQSSKVPNVPSPYYHIGADSNFRMASPTLNSSRFISALVQRLSRLSKERLNLHCSNTPF